MSESTDFFGYPVDITSLTTSLHEALTSEPPNEEEIVRIFKKTNNKERLLIREEYKKLYRRSVQKDMSDELSYKLREVCIALMDSIYEFDARELHKAFHLFTNDDKVICEIMASRSKEHLNFVDSAYHNFYGISLKDEIKKETSVVFCKLLHALMSTKRATGPTINQSEAETIANDLTTKGIKTYESDIEAFKDVFLVKSRDDLIKISQAYFEKNKKTLYKAISEDLKSPSRKLFKAILFSTISPAEYFSKKVYKGLRGLGTDIRQVMRALVYEEHEMDLLREFYKKFRNIPMYDDVKDDCGGSYGEILCDLCLK